MKKKVYYRGDPYDFEIVERKNVRYYALYTGGEFKYYVTEDALDIRSRVSMILDSYYTNDRSALSTRATNY